MNIDNEWGKKNKDPLSFDLGEVSSLVIKGAITLGLIGIVGGFFGDSK